MKTHSMRIAVCEDEKVFRRQLGSYLEKAMGSLDSRIDEYASGEELLSSYEEGRYYDVIFMDIEMKQIDGLETAKKIREYRQDEVIIFLTSHTEYALQGYEVKALRFLEKPVKEEKLRETLQELRRMQNKNKSISVHTSDGEYRVSIEEIVYVESIRNDIYVHTNKKMEYRERKSLKEFYSEVDQGLFYQCHRSYLINLNYVVSYNVKEAVLENGTRIPISRGRAKELKELLMENF